MSPLWRIGVPLSLSISLILTGTALAVNGTVDDVPSEPVPQQNEVAITIHRNLKGVETWRIGAFQSDAGLCLHATIPNIGSGGACGFDVPSRAVGYVVENINDTTYVYGPTSTATATVKINILDAAPVLVSTVASPPELPQDLRFYSTSIPGNVQVTSVESLSALGESLDTRGVSVEPDSEP